MRNRTLMGCIILLIAIVMYYFSTESKQLIQKNVKGKEMYGREKKQKELISKVLSGEHRIIEIVGNYGVGKTTFILNTTEKLVKSHNYCCLYINMPVDIGTDVTSLFVNTVLQEECMSVQNSWMTIFTSVSIRFLKLLQDFAQYFQIWNYNWVFEYWFEQLKPNTILILDHSDKVLEKVEKEIFQPLLATASSKSVIAILISGVSHKEIQYLRRPVISLEGIEPSLCAQWITTRYEQVTLIEAKRLCHELGGIPSDVIDAIELTMHPLTSHSINELIRGVENREYGQAFQYLESVLGRHFKDTRERNIAMYVHYNRLSFEHRECAWLLVEITINGEFTKDMAESHLEMNVDDCLESLLRNLLLQTIQKPYKRFHFRPNIIKFIQSIGQPTPFNDDVRTKVWIFYGNYVKHNARSLFSKLKVSHDLQLAINIGSDRELVNSLVPLLDENFSNKSLMNISVPLESRSKYSLTPLFRIALDIIEKHYCSSSSRYNNSTPEALLAFTYLTKAIHCPSIHPPTMLLRQKVTSKPDICFNKLINCPAILSMEKDTYKAAEALGYHNALMIYASNNTLPTAPWTLSLIDLSMIVTVANRECAKFCISDNYCYCGKFIDIERGLRLFLLRKYADSIKYFQSTLHRLSDGNSPCQTILKLIASAAIESTNRKLDKQVPRMDVDFNNFNISCFLGVLNDLIIPYLVELKHKESQNLLRVFNELVNKEEKQCNNEPKTEEERLDCLPKIRYTIAHGLTALKMIELQDSLRWPQRVMEYSLREEWVCSIIRDKTTRCEDSLPLFSLVRSIETNKNYKPLWSMQYFLEQAEYKQLYERATAIPRFFQLMSI